MTLEGKVALVTGGSQGIGAAIARKLASEGADIAILYVGNPVPAEETVAAIEAMGRRVFCQVCDVSDFDATQAAVKEVIAQLGGVDILVNNAAITRDKVLLAMSEADWDSVLDINLKSMFNTIKACYRNFMKKKAGRIINITSVAGIMGNAGQANYASSKAGVIGLTKTVARELASRHINCNAIAPGAIRTPMTDSMDPKDLQAILDTIPLGFMGEAEDIAEMAAFLASDKAKYITGEVIRIDGGIAM
ncbi:MAG: 3-oxoacyl-[Oscillospiraceae bacterium]|nr:3-oxoacyl-[acyl-carrier-protein] reductase [Oscillospiraceae bacterium]